MITRLLELWEGSPTPFLTTAAACLFVLWLAVRMSLIDIRSHTLPNRLILSAWVVGALLLTVSALAASQPVWAVTAVLGSAATVGAYWLLWRAYPAGVGFGDVKSSGIVGLYLGFLGWGHVLLGVAAGFVVGGVWVLVLMVSGRGSLKSAVPLAPAMFTGALLVMLLP